MNNSNTFNPNLDSTTSNNPANLPNISTPNPISTSNSNIDFFYSQSVTANDIEWSNTTQSILSNIYNTHKRKEVDISICMPDIYMP